MKTMRKNYENSRQRIVRGLKGMKKEDARLGPSIPICGDGTGHHKREAVSSVSLIATQPPRYGSRSPNVHVCRTCTTVSSSGEDKRRSGTPVGRWNVEGGRRHQMILQSTSTLSVDYVHLIRASRSSSNPEHTSVKPPYHS